MKLLLIGWDAADWKIINPLLDAGLMPALSKLINEGVMGNIATLDPPLSPMLWTSIATGKRAYDHGILNFTEPDAKNNFIRPVNVTSRKVKAIWNILSQNNFKTNLVGWWPSHPAEPINGSSVSNFFQHARTDDKGTMQLVSGCIYPAELEHVLKELIIEPREITPAMILPFIPEAFKIDQEKDNALQAFARIMSDATNVHTAATWLMENTEWDFTAVYLDAIDHFCHRFMRYHPPKQEHIDEAQFNLYKNVVNGAYRFHDMMLERLLELAGDDTTVILLSDHGFHSDHLRLKFLPKEPAAPAYEHRHHGILVMNGPGIKKDERIYGNTLLDITPTVLHLFNLPVGRDMEGRIILDAFSQSHSPQFIDSWEKVEGQSGMHSNEIRNDPWAEQIELNQLIELGYIENPGEDKQKALKVCVDESQFNLARTYMDGNKLNEAYSILQPLYAQNKEVVRFALTYLNCCARFGKPQDAFEVLNALKENEKASYLNFKQIEGNLYFGLNKIRKALLCYNESIEKQLNNNQLQFSAGRCYMKLQRFDDAETAFLKALSSDEDNAGYLFALAGCYFAQKRFEECVEICLQTIGLLFYFPKAHYLLGESLFQLNQMNESAAAFELYLTMQPKNRKARQRIIEIYKNENMQSDNKAALHQKYIDSHSDEVIYIVSGLPRSGTSMMMQMLHAGGLNVLTDGARHADAHNQKGYYEYEPVKRIATDTSWLDHAKGKAVKIIAQGLLHLPPRYNYKVIFMERDLSEVIHSQQVMLGRAEHGKPANYPLALATAFGNTLEKIKKLETEKHFSILYVPYKNVIENTLDEIFEIEKFLDLELNTSAMQQVVDAGLYRSKTSVPTNEKQNE